MYQFKMEWKIKMHRINKLNLQHKKLHIAVVTALSIAIASHANAACTALSASTYSTTGINVDLTTCTGGESALNNTGSLGNNSATATGATVWVEGLGNTVTNSGTISRSSTIGNTYGVFLGDYSVGRNNAANLAITNGASGNSGTTTLRITVPATSGTNTALAGTNALVGKHILMAGVVVDGEARPGDLRTITSAQAVSGSPNTYDIVVNRAWTRVDANGNPISQAGNSYNLLAGSGVNTLNNSGTISATYTGTATANIRAVETNIAGDYVINNTNTGTIIGTHTSVGTAQGVDAGGDVTSMTINNDGLIKAVRTSGTITLTSNKFNELKGTAGGITNQSIGSAAAIYSQEELESITINNASGAGIIGEGDLAPAIYMRAGAQTIVNDGTISGSKNGANYGMGIGSVSDGGEIRTLSLENTGTINGAVLGVNANAYRYYALSNFDGATANSSSTNTNFVENRLLTNGSNWGQLDSTINNSGTINGKVYLSNGTHTITNTGTVTGGIDLDQRDTKTQRVNNTDAGFAPGALGANTIQTAVVEVVKTSGSTTQTTNVYASNVAAGVYSTSTTGLAVPTAYTTTITAPGSSSTALSGLFTVVGTKSFTFENAGTFNGDILVHTASSNALGHAVTSDITLIPTINGAGGASADTANTSNINGFNGDLIVVSTVAAGGAVDDITIAPKAATGVTIKNGQFYKVTNGVQVGTTYAGVASMAAGATDLPSVSGNGLVNWTPSINTFGALVLESQVNSANVAGISGSAANALTALMSFDSVLGSKVQNLATDAEVRQAANELQPEINGGGIQAMSKVSNQVLGLVENRLAQTHLAAMTGVSGISTGESASGTGVWLEGYGSTGEQDKRNNVDGYSVDGYGFAIGADTLVGSTSNLRVGGAFSYGQSNIANKGISKNTMDINSYQATAYASMLFYNYYINANLSLGNHDLDTRRVVLGNRVSGNHDAWQYTAKIDAGLPLKFGKANFIPVASLAYSYLDESGYTENGIGALNVNSNNTDSIRSGLGARALLPLFDKDNVNAALEVRAIWNHEFADTAQDSTARFATGGSSFNVSGVSLARDSANLGATLHLSGDTQNLKQSLLLSYDAEVKDQYVSHTGKLQARFDF